MLCLLLILWLGGCANSPCSCLQWIIYECLCRQRPMNARGHASGARSGASARQGRLKGCGRAFKLRAARTGPLIGGKLTTVLTCGLS